ncbi:MAG: ribosome-associated translation inhibitor RaiA [Lachnospiraceae bacterium]|nr:ribosome-associated translation inhibitor RaiA [Lachnospiraceae bacterium]
MNYIISGKNIDVTDGLKNTIYSDFKKLEKYFPDDTDILVTLSVQKDRQTAEATIPIKGSVIRSEQTSSDMYVSIDLVADVIERQLKKYRSKLITRKQSAQSFSSAFIEAEAEEDFDNDIKIVKEKKILMKPMTPEDACLEMELLGHNFYVFTNADTDEINVVYKRKGNTYGLIEPEF